MQSAAANGTKARPASKTTTTTSRKTKSSSKRRAAPASAHSTLAPLEHDVDLDDSEDDRLIAALRGRMSASEREALDRRAVVGSDDDDEDEAGDGNGNGDGMGVERDGDGDGEGEDDEATSDVGETLTRKRSSSVSSTRESRAMEVDSEAEDEVGARKTMKKRRVVVIDSEEDE